MYLDNDAASRRSYYSIAYAFMIVATVIEAFAIIPLAWCIPMTATCGKAMKDTGSEYEKSHMVLGVFTLLAMPLIAWVGAIFIIIASSNFNSKQMMMPNMGQMNSSNAPDTFNNSNNN